MALKTQLEALLFSSGKAMDEEQLAQLTGSEKKAVRAALKALEKDYAERDTALKVFSDGAMWRMLVKDEHIGLVRRIVADTELSKATLETLAVIAYQQPQALQSKIVDMRGSGAYDHIKELESMGFVTKAKQGRSFVLKLTDKFFDYFDVEGGKDIKKAFSQVQVPLPKEQQKQLGGLEVVDVPPEPPKKDKLGGLEVIDEAPEEEHEPTKGPWAKQEDEETASEDDDDPFRSAKLERDPAAESDFLSKIDQQIASLSSRNDELDRDSLFQRAPEQAQGEQAPVAEEGTQAQPAEPTEAAADEAKPVATAPAKKHAPHKKKAPAEKLAPANAQPEQETETPTDAPAQTPAPSAEQPAEPAKTDAPAKPTKKKA